MLISLFQFWHLDDSCTEMGRCTCICHWNRTWNKCYNWYWRDSCIPNLAISYFNSQNRTLVNLVSGKACNISCLLKFTPYLTFIIFVIVYILHAVELPFVMYWFDMGPKSPIVGMYADGWSGNLPTWLVDVWLVCYPTNAGANEIVMCVYIMIF